MNRRNVVRFALAAALFGAAVPGAAMAQVIAQGKYWTPKAQVQVQVQSDRFFHDRFYRDMFEGRWVAQDRYDADDRFGGGYGNYGGGRWGDGFGNGRWGGRMAMLPDFMTIDQGRRFIRVLDDDDDLIQLIAIDDGFHPSHRGVPVLDGDLNGNRLVATGSGPRGQQIQQTMTLRNHGNTLIVRTQVQRGWGRTVEVEKVYTRA